MSDEDEEVEREDAAASADRGAGGAGGVDRRGVLALGVVLAVLAICGGVLLLGGGGDTTGSDQDGDAKSADDSVPAPGDSGSATPVGDGEGEDEGSTTVDTTRAAVLEGLAEGLVRGSDGVISQGEADCMAEALVAHLGLERLIELGDQARGTEREMNPLSALSPEEQSAAVAVMLPCADSETRARIDPDWNGT